MNTAQLGNRLALQADLPVYVVGPDGVEHEIVGVRVAIAEQFDPVSEREPLPLRVIVY